MTTPQPPPASTLPPETCPHCGAVALTKHLCHCGAEKPPPTDWTVYECETWKGHAHTSVAGDGHRGDACYEREIASLRADKERLDWLENPTTCYHVCVSRQPDGFAIINCPPTITGIRAAIDAARKEAK